MPYEVRRSPAARQDVRDFFRYLKREAGETTARLHFQALEHDLTRLIAGRPHALAWFHETYWIIYVVDDANEVVEFVRFWNAAREPGTHGL